MSTIVQVLHFVLKTNFKHMFSAEIYEKSLNISIGKFLAECHDIETWLEIPLLIIRTETLSIPENDLRVLVLNPMIFGNLAIYHFQNKQTTINT